MIKEFKSFLLRGNVVDLAVAVVVGTAFTALIAALVANLLTPVIAALFGKHDFSTLTFTINGSVFKYGSFLLHNFTKLMAGLGIAYHPPELDIVSQDRNHRRQK